MRAAVGTSQIGILFFAMLTSLSAVAMNCETQVLLSGTATVEGKTTAMPVSQLNGLASTLTNQMSLVDYSLNPTSTKVTNLNVQFVEDNKCPRGTQRSCQVTLGPIFSDPSLARASSSSRKCYSSTELPYVRDLEMCEQAIKQLAIPLCPLTTDAQFELNSNYEIKNALSKEWDLAPSLEYAGSFGALLSTANQSVREVGSYLLWGDLEFLIKGVSVKRTVPLHNISTLLPDYLKFKRDEFQSSSLAVISAIPLDKNGDIVYLRLGVMDSDLHRDLCRIVSRIRSELYCGEWVFNAKSGEFKNLGNGDGGTFIALDLPNAPSFLMKMKAVSDPKTFNMIGTNFYTYDFGSNSFSNVAFQIPGRAETGTYFSGIEPLHGWLISHVVGDSSTDSGVYVFYNLITKKTFTTKDLGFDTKSRNDFPNLLVDSQELVISDHHKTARYSLDDLAKAGSSATPIFQFAPPEHATWSGQLVGNDIFLYWDYHGGSIADPGSEVGSSYFIRPDAKGGFLKKQFFNTSQITMTFAPRILQFKSGQIDFSTSAIQSSANSDYLTYTIWTYDLGTKTFTNVCWKSLEYPNRPPGPDARTACSQ
jgi:hypothetical protein